MGRTGVSNQIQRTMKILRMNGMSFRDIAKTVDVSLGTAHNHTKDVIVLPKKMQQNPFEVAKKVRETAIEKVPTNDDIENAIDNIEYWIGKHEDGERWEGPLDEISLDRLIEVMREPTGFHSPLSFEEWFNYYLSEEFYGENTSLTKTQIKVAKFLFRYPKALIKVFRGMGKTTEINGILLYLICENPDNCYAIQSRESSVSVKRVTQVQRELMTNKKIIADYGYLPHEKKWGNVSMSWKQSELTVKRDINKVDPTLMALSWKDTKMLGGHFDGVVFDDPWSEKLERNSERNKDKWFSWYDGTFQGCLNPDAFEWFICTPKGVNDIYKELEDRDTHAVYKQPALFTLPSKYKYIKDENGVITHVDNISDDYDISDDCNGRYDIKFWLMKKKSIDPLKWEQEYQINPMPPKGLVLEWDRLKFFSGLKEWNEMTEKCNVRAIGALDIAFSKSKRADYTALVIVSLFEGDFYILQGWAIRGLGKSGKVTLLKKAKNLFPYLEAVYIEADLQQSEDFRELKEMAEGYVTLLPVLSRQEQKTLNRNSNLSGKEVRILSQLDIPLEGESIHINKSMNCYDEFAKEFRSFPRGDHDDVLDALGNAISKLKRKQAIIFGLSG